ncbi:hypothetical protein PODOV084v1_p0041 [Vibrio phage 340E47.2]|nr:hypothetical protein PODOV084v1_p0041 [Vibrio phage 340E47.2]QZI91947.1 hypothetical protein PODOV077v1_p0036 [Vibrio phage 5P1a]
MNNPSIYKIISEARSLNPSDVTCVYFLIRDSKIVYVGQTINLEVRLTTHRQSKDFDSYNFIEVESEHADFVESVYIHALRPELNSDVSGNFEDFETKEKKAPLSVSKLISKFVELGEDK